MIAADPQRHVAAILGKLDAGLLDATTAAREIAARLEDARITEELVEDVRVAVAQVDAERVSVRSSATCEDSTTSAWAGQLTTYLDVSPDDVPRRIRDCWLSAFTASALAYGAAHGYGAGQFGVAVAVQTMVASAVSGIGFSVHPVTQEPNVLLVEACIGLGEAIVSGQIEIRTNTLSNVGQAGFSSAP